jgi:phosphoadenosine phosphosulfate reductase
MRASRYQSHMTPLQTMVDEAINFLRCHEPPEGYTLADSYGKDSTVLLELARMAGVKFVHIHNRTGIDPPQLMRFGREHHPGARELVGKITMWEGIHHRGIGPPRIQTRWCCDVLKHYYKPAFPRAFLVGVRAEESPGRLKRGRINKKGKTVNYSPIFLWTAWHVWEFIEGLNLPYCELYDEGFDRLGCCVCPMITSKNMGKVKQHMQWWPGYYKAFEHAVTHWFYNHAWWDRHKHKTAERFIQAWYRGFH